MSTLLFKDTVTIYSKSGDESDSFTRRVVKNTKLIETKLSGGNARGELFIPLYGRRDLKYLPKGIFDSLNDNEGFFTVSPDDVIVTGVCLLPSPPEEGFKVTSVKEMAYGSRRLRHIKVYSEIYPSADTLNISSEVQS